MSSLLLALALLLTPAHANKTYMWGVGGNLGTWALPGAYPIMFPPKVSDNGTMDKAHGDVLIDAEGMYWLDKTNRIGAMLGLDKGGDFSDVHLILKYDYMTQLDAMDVFVGGGLGVASSTWNGRDEEKLRVPNYPLRVEAGLLWRDKTWAIQGTAFAQYNWPSNHVYTNAVGDEVDVGTGIYALIGLEVGGFWGDYKKPGKSDGKKSKSSKKSSSGKSSSKKK